MEDAIINMILSSVMGAAAGVYFATILNPFDNYLIFVALFALIGIGGANLVLLMLFEIHRWLKQYYIHAETTKNSQSA